jgi:hypothetical protein
MQVSFAFGQPARERCSEPPSVTPLPRLADANVGPIGVIAYERCTEPNVAVRFLIGLVIDFPFLEACDTTLGRISRGRNGESWTVTSELLAKMAAPFMGAEKQDGGTFHREQDRNLILLPPMRMPSRRAQPYGSETERTRILTGFSHSLSA